MTTLGNRISGLDYERSIWVEQDDLGKEKVIWFNDKRYTITIPREIDKDVIVRLRGLGKTRNNKTGDLLLHIWLNKGEDIRKSLWLSETSARNGADKKLFLEGKTITMVVPPHSYQGLTMRLRGFGKERDFNWRAPFLRRKRGNALVKLFVYPDTITPTYGSFDMLSTENMALEGWVYRKFDEVIHRVGRSALPAHPIEAGAMADLFNERGWTSIFHALVRHLKLDNLIMELTTSASTSPPGSCERTASIQNNTVVRSTYKLTINEQFLDNPFSVTAILAHELCHVIYAERIDKTFKPGGTGIKTKQETLEEERTVDLLAFMYKIGEFQLRVARDKRLTLGYFDQEIFERMQVIVSRKLTSL